MTETQRREVIEALCQAHGESRITNEVFEKTLRMVLANA